MKFDIVIVIVYLRNMIKVILLGSGNVSTHLFRAFSKANEIEVTQVFSRTLSKDFPESLQTTNFSKIAEADIYIVCVQPLIKETAEKIQSLSPSEAQTGPAIRKDYETIEKHIDFLTNENQKEIYKILTKSIQNG